MHNIPGNISALCAAALLAASCLSSTKSEGGQEVIGFAPVLGTEVRSGDVSPFPEDMDFGVWAVTEDGDVHDTFMHMSGVVEGDTMEALQVLAKELDARNEHGKSENTEACRFAELWNGRMEAVKRLINGYEPAYSQMAAVRMFERSLQNIGYRRHVHYANSNAVRLACIYSRHYVWCNRGVNGIEGSVSTAAGFSLATDDVVFCVTGDLSFFYDQNALWNVDLKGILRIILLNNNCGGIFYSLKGLRDSAAFKNLVAAGHNATAHGICEQNKVMYISTHNTDELCSGLEIVTEKNSQRPILLEVFTDAEEDKRVIKYFMNHIKTSWEKESGSL